ncbi:MAG: hypothetical protein KAJ51_01285 [Thermoplasmata archaeon]|nr:hypothetical protein [Thermoplasmata archaeon]
MTSTKTAKESGEQPSKNRILHILDIVVFLLILISLSFAIVVIGIDINGDGTNGFSTDTDKATDDYANNFNEVLLSSTIPRVAYINSYGNETIFIGYSVSQLILEDVYLRWNPDSTLNLTSLKNGIEAEITKLASNLILSKYSFKFSVTSVSAEPFELTAVEGIASGAEVITTTSKSLLSLDQGEEVQVKLQLYH